MVALAEEGLGPYILPDPDVPALHRVEARENKGTGNVNDDPLLAAYELEISPNNLFGMCKVIEAVRKDGFDLWISRPAKRAES